MLSFFRSADDAARRLDDRAEVRGQVITMQDASLAGRAIFGEVLTDN